MKDFAAKMRVLVLSLAISLLAPAFSPDAFAARSSSSASPGASSAVSYVAGRKRRGHPRAKHKKPRARRAGKRGDKKDRGFEL